MSVADTVLLIIAAFGAASCLALLCNEWMLIHEKARFQKQARRRLGAIRRVDRDTDMPETTGRAEKDVGILAQLIRHLPGSFLFKRREKKRLIVSYERDLPACLEVIALGMQSGMGFDQAFSLYTERFDTALARCCRESLAIWQKGLKSREEGMRELADRIDTPAFRHFISSVLRALHFGAPMTKMLMDLALEARKEYRAKRQEMVAKAPVKMLLPTGILILPAMLLLVMGPIILDLLRKMG